MAHILEFERKTLSVAGIFGVSCIQTEKGMLQAESPPKTLQF